MTEGQRRRIGHFLVGLGVLLLAAGLGGLASALHGVTSIGPGYTAKVLCSSVFVARRPLATAFAEDLLPTARLFRARVDRRAGTVAVSWFGLRGKTAIHRPGLGCTLAHDVDLARLRAEAPPPPPPLPADDWPPRHDRAGIDGGQLDALVASAFTQSNTRALVIVLDGRLLAEGYGPGFAPDMALPGWSMAKTATAALVGVLVGQGRLSVAAPAPVAAWRAPGDPRGGITLEHLLHMTSGLDFSEVHLYPFADVNRMLWHAPDTAGFTAARPPRDPPGKIWHYASGTTNVIARIVCDTVGGGLAGCAAFAREALFAPLGMRGAVFEPDAAGTLIGSSFLHAPARDWARLGQLLLDDGVWREKRVLPAGWVGYMLRPAPAARRGRYGAQVWLNAGESSAGIAPGDQRPWPGLPRDTFMARGFEQQFVTVVPSRRLVVVRLGRDSPTGFSQERFVARLLAALPVSDLAGR